MFLDTYFDEEDEREESIVNYAPVSASEDDGHMLQDPLLAGSRSWIPGLTSLRLLRFVFAGLIRNGGWYCKFSAIRSHPP
jgi:hypothetical protein